jgi:hypothetical protein
MDSGLNWEGIITRLSNNAGRVKHGEAGVILKIHEGKIVHITHSVTETAREPGGAIADTNSPGCEDQKSGEILTSQ